MAREQRPETKARTIPTSDPLNHGLLMYGRRLFFVAEEGSVQLCDELWRPGWEVLRGPDERWPGVPEQPARRSKTRVMRAARGRCECQGPRGRISRRPCLQRGGLCPHWSAGGLGRREKLPDEERRRRREEKGVFPFSDWRWPVCSGVGRGWPACHRLSFRSVSGTGWRGRAAMWFEERRVPCSPLFLKEQWLPLVAKTPGGALASG